MSGWGYGRSYNRSGKFVRRRDADAASDRKAQRISRARSTRRGRDLVKLVRSVAEDVSLSHMETKLTHHVGENTQLYHNQTYYRPALMFTAEGTAGGRGTNNTNRIGDEIIARGMSVKLWLSNKEDRPNVMYKIILFKYPTMGGYAVNDTMLWNGMDGKGAAMNRMIDSVATSRVHILKQLMIKPDHGANYSMESGVGMKEKSHFAEFYVPLNNLKVKYMQPTTDPQHAIFPQDHDICLAVVAYDAYGTEPTDELASYAHSIKFYFKDA